MFLIPIELFLALIVWNRKWKELALIPFIIVMSIHLALGHLNNLTDGGVSNSASGYMMLVHMLAIISLCVMTFFRPERIKARQPSK